MGIRITRRFEFDMAHRVRGHESKCAHLHGHRYVADVTCSAKSLDAVGRVIDFSEIKRIVGGWIDLHWDHNIMLHSDDPMLRAAVPADGLSWGQWAMEFRGRPSEGLEALMDPPHPLAGLSSAPLYNCKAPFIVPDGGNTTVEVMVKVLFDAAVELLRDYDIEVNAVRIYETPNCWADYEPTKD